MTNEQDFNLTPETLRERLLELEDASYRDFHLKTCPQAQHVIGVRLPEQRKLAKQIIKSDNYWHFLDGETPHYYEEVMITGIIIASAPMRINERFDYIIWFLPLINNWAICDTFCNSFKIKDSDLDTYWNFLVQLTASSEEYTLRFVFVMFLCHFIKPNYLNKIFQLLDEIQSDFYYVNMAKAWLIAEIFAKFKDEAFEYLSRDQLPVTTHNKAIQKACESRRLSPEDKQRLRSMKL